MLRCGAMEMCYVCRNKKTPQSFYWTPTDFYIVSCARRFPRLCACIAKQLGRLCCVQIWIEHLLGVRARAHHFFRFACVQCWHVLFLCSIFFASLLLKRLMFTINAKIIVFFFWIHRHCEHCVPLCCRGSITLHYMCYTQPSTTPPPDIRLFDIFFRDFFLCSFCASTFLPHEPSRNRKECEKVQKHLITGKGDDWKLNNCTK